MSLLIAGLLPYVAFCQDNEEDEGYFSEFTAGVDFNTNAGLIGGLALKYTREIKKNQYHFFGLEILNVKHPQEQKYQSNSTGNIYIYGKLNNLFPVRLQYGREIIIFHPAAEEGVQVKFIYAGGPTLGFVKPYEIEYDYGTYSQIEPFDPDKGNPILGSGGPLSGFDQLKVVPGINIKSSFCFEFSQFRGSVTGIEVGGLLEAYSERIHLMALPSYSSTQPYSPQLFSSVFVNIFFGLRK